MQDIDYPVRDIHSGSSLQFPLVVQHAPKDYVRLPRRGQSVHPLKS